MSGPRILGLLQRATDSERDVFEGGTDGQTFDICFNDECIVLHVVGNMLLLVEDTRLPLGYLARAGLRPPLTRYSVVIWSSPAT